MVKPNHDECRNDDLHEKPNAYEDGTPYPLTTALLTSSFLNIFCTQAKNNQVQADTGNNEPRIHSGSLGVRCPGVKPENFGSRAGCATQALSQGLLVEPVGELGEEAFAVAEDEGDRGQSSNPDRITMKLCAVHGAGT